MFLGNLFKARRNRFAGKDTWVTSRGALRLEPLARVKVTNCFGLTRQGTIAREKVVVNESQAVQRGACRRTFRLCRKFRWSDNFRSCLESFAGSRIRHAIDCLVGTPIRHATHCFVVNQYATLLVGWRHLETERFGVVWRCLESFAEFRAVLKTFCRVCGVLCSFGEVWRGLERFGEVWRGLERFGEVWGGLERFGEVWRGLERFGK